MAEDGSLNMNILFHCWEYPPRGSGIGRYVYYMTRALREAGHYTVVVTSHGDEGPSTEVLDHGMVYRLYRYEEIGRDHIAQLVMTKALEHEVDWIEGADHLGESSVLLQHKLRPPVVIKAHYNDVVKCARYAQAHYRWQKFFIDAACWRDRNRLKRERKSLEQADILIAPSRRILDEMKSQGLPLSARQGVVPNPITPLPDWINKEAPVPTLLLVGRIDIGKGIDCLPQLVDILSPQFPELRIEIAGEDSYARLLGSTKRWLLREAGHRGVHFHFLGHLGSDELDEAYRRAWVVIVPSHWDTFPTVVLEAMVRGKAIVSSPNGGMPEMLADTSCVVADPTGPEFADAIAVFLADQEQRKKAGCSGLSRAKTKYSFDCVADTYLDFIKTNL